MTIGRGFSISAITGAALVLSGAAASAQGWLGQAEWYVKGFGGATFPQNDDVTVGAVGGNVVPLGSNELQYDTGYVLGAAIGSNFTPNFAMELEYAYRHADVTRNNNLFGSTDGEAASNAFMLNALYNFNGMGPNGAWQPYIGGGLGAADLTVDDIGADFDGDYKLAYQVIGGVAYDITPAWSLLGEVRWFGIDSQDLEGGGSTMDTTFDIVDVLVGAIYSF
jgi:opacity protein-like surface antigen